MGAGNTNASFTTESPAHYLRCSSLSQFTPLSAGNRESVEPNGMYSLLIRKYEGKLCRDGFASLLRSPGAHYLPPVFSTLFSTAVFSRMDFRPQL